MDTKEIIHSALQIEKVTADRSYGNILTLLADLDESEVTAEQLERTDIIKVLYRLLRSCSDDGVKKKVKSLLSKWKRQYRKYRCTEESKQPELSCTVSSSLDGVLNQEELPSGSALKEEVSSTAAENGLQVPTSTGESASASSDFQSIRNKCVQLLVAALCPETTDQEAATHLAGHIERHIHDLHASNQVKYKTCVRSKVANLRNLKNSHLRQGLLSGSLSPGDFAQMSAEEMASADLRRLREEYSSRGVSERQLPRGVEGTRTQKIRCKRCGGSDCEVSEVSRGALFLPAWVRRGGPDEDAMTFVTCSGCGQQWYHSRWVCL
ncbi:transcription elongation factor A N-terminal and central domain-containing protein [Echeneis naucrates]|uniref:transcription elongation factor A N-terminal and central domain-containing protein n=1 Tax=Echeneis naucrates TaxID=173247 RepID=UPI001113669E|nr:transcription elongation factor A N-terminal and central domain-containing protein [Echeneis naucrates]